MDLLVLLAIALAGVAFIALIVMGLLVVPWLVLIALFALLFALLKVPLVSQEQMAWSLEREAEGQTEGEREAIASNSRKSKSPATSHADAVEQAMVYRGAKYQSHPQPLDQPEAEETIEIVGTYRGKTCSLKVKNCTKD